MLLNGVGLSDRFNRPSVLSKVALQTVFLQDGELVDPYQISAVTIYNKDYNLSPSTLIASSDNLLSSGTSGYVLMNFANSSPLTSNSSFNASNYTPGTTASGIFKVSTGRYVVVLDGTVNLSGSINLWGVTSAIANTASATGRYLDIWTVRMTAGSDLQLVINDFQLRKGGFTTVTEPILFKTNTRLLNSKVTLGSKVDLKIATDVHIENRNISEEVKNLFRDTVITSGMLEIQKMNEESNLPARVTVSSYSDTSATVEIGADNVMTLLWDTSQLATHAQTVAGNLGSLQGVYSVKAKFNILTETIVTEPMFLTVV